MEHWMYVLILITAVCSLRMIAARVSIHSPGGHVGDEINLHCNIRNHGLAEFFRFKDGEKEFISTDNSTKYAVYRCDKTEDGVSGEDSVLTVFEASVLDSGTYGCVPKTNGEFEWDARELTNITVESACSGADGTNPSSLSTEASQSTGHDSEKQLRKDTVVQQSSQSSVAVPVLAVLFGVTLVALCVVLLLWYRDRQN